MMKKDLPVCRDSRYCKHRDRESKCYVLSSTYEKNGECPFFAKRDENEGEGRKKGAAKG